jgi:CRP/FNR family cyclic AMP-dependent transcriptional regulator
MSSTPQALDRFASAYKAGDVIFCEYEPGDKFYMLKKGRVKLMRVIGDVEKTVSILQTGDFFGEMAILGNVPRSATAIALEETIVLAFGKENFEIMVKSNLSMSISLLNLFSKRIYDQKRQLQILQLDDNTAKVADVLIMLSEGLAAPHDNNSQRNIPVNVEAVATWAGLSPDIVRRILNGYVDQRKMTVYSDQIIVNNINELQRFVNTKRRKI